MKPNSNSKSNANVSSAQSDYDLLAQLAEEEEGVSPPSEPKLKSKINLVKEFEAAAADGRSALERVRIDASETAIVPFTAEAEQVDIHYCKEPDLNDYITCNGKNCVLCKIGREKTVRRLLPVYLPASGIVGVLPVSPSLRPRALWPQLFEAMKDGTEKALFISRIQSDGFSVSAVSLPEDADAGEATIAAFLKDYEAGRIELASVYPHVDNESLAAIPEIARMLKLKGIKVG
jgi:hypothetical protein